jgi:hypothetical protein
MKILITYFNRIKTCLIILFIFCITQGSIAQSYDSTKVKKIINEWRKSEEYLNIVQNQPNRKNFNRFKKQLSSIKNTYTADSLYMQLYLFKKFEKGCQYYDSNKMDSALYCFLNCHDILKFNKMVPFENYQTLYKNIFIIYNEKKDARSKYFLNLSISYGNDELDDLLMYYKNNENVSEDTLYQLLHNLNKNYLINNKSIGDIDITFRYIYFMDQLYRINCYNKRLFNYSYVRKNDSIMQTIFIPILNGVDSLNILINSCYQKTFSLLLIHSVATPNTMFFENYFRIFSKAFNNDFVSYSELPYLIDMYLKFRYNQQYFGTIGGQGVLPDKSWGLLPKMDKAEFEDLLIRLGIYNAIY